ncbi:MAG: ATP-binding protein [Nitrospirota bacterium]
MPFNTLPREGFISRDTELSHLKQLIAARDAATARNVLLEGARGIGKTELLKQLYRTVYQGSDTVVPFYYSFQRAALKGTHFARDYFMRFVRQYLASVKQDPSLVNAMSTPLTRLMPLIASLRAEWMIDLIEDFNEQVREGDLHGQLLGAISAPVTAAEKSGRTLLVMLDDFHLAPQLYEHQPGDVPGLVSLFESSLRSPVCPHILTGSPEGALESIFTDNAFRGQAERLFVRALDERAALGLFRYYCTALGIREQVESSLKFMKFLGGNPLYIRNAARSLWKMQKKELSERDLWECYSYEVSEGETAFYWSSILGEFIRDVDQRRVAIELLMHSIKSNTEFHDIGRLSRVLGIPERSIRQALDALQMSGIVQAGGSLRHLKDNVLQDFIQSLYLREVEGRSTERVRELIETKYYTEGSEAACFEMVIPMSSDAELVAARAVEQIGKNIHLNPDVTNHIQLALIEACINAMEHSGSYEKKVFLKFTVSPERIEIAIETPGKLFEPEFGEGVTAEDKLNTEHKRGWGLKLMRTVMDEVKVERIGEKTRVLLVKKIKPDEVLR